MKNILIIALIVLALIAMFGDGGLEVSPTLSPALEFSPALDLKPSVNYVPTHIDTNIEQQTVIVQGAQQYTGDWAPANGGVTVLDNESMTGPGCVGLYPGERIYNGPDMQGACFVENDQGQKFFINIKGVRWLLN